MDTKVAIVGAGPAGISAAVQLKRQGIDSVIFEKDKIGGLIRNAYLVENTMLYPPGIPGLKFADILKTYAEKYNLKILKKEVMGVTENEEYFTLKTEDGEYTAKYLIVGTGTRPKTLPFPDLKYHITELDKDNIGSAVIIGGGDIALDYSLSLSEISRKVTILHRSEIKANKVLQAMVTGRKNIHLMKGSVKNIMRNNNRFIIETYSEDIETEMVLVAIGRVPNIDLVKHIKNPKMFIIGDAKNGIYRQSSIAIADGIRTAMQIWRWEEYGNP